MRTRLPIFIDLDQLTARACPVLNWNFARVGEFSQRSSIRAKLRYAVIKQGWVFRLRHGQRLFVLLVGVGPRAEASAAALDAFKGGRIEDSCRLSSELRLFLNLYEGRIIKLQVMNEWPQSAQCRRITLRARLQLLGQRRAAESALRNIAS